MSPYLFLVFILLIVLIFLHLFFPTANVFLHIAILKKYKKVQYNADYFRDILSYSPSEIFYIYNHRNIIHRLIDFRFPLLKFKKLFLINLLKMDLLNYIDIDFKDKNNFTIIKKDVIFFDKEYKLIYDFIFTEITQKKEITLYEIYKYIDENYQNKFFTKWYQLIQSKLNKRGYYEGNFITFHEDKIRNLYKINIPIIIILNIVLFFFSFKFAVLMIFVFSGFLFFGYEESKYHKIVSDSGIYEYRKIKALKRFLKDFSVMNERTPEYTKLLEDYVIYANIFNLTKQNITNMLIK